MHSTQMEVGDEISKRNEESVPRKQRGLRRRCKPGEKSILPFKCRGRERHEEGGDLGGAAQSLIINKGKGREGKREWNVIAADARS